MVNPKGQGRKASKEVGGLAVQRPDEAKGQGEQSPGEEPMVKPLDEVMGQAEKAYAAYMEAERQVARIYKSNEVQVANAYRKAEEQANRACEEGVRQALEARDEAIEQASEVREEAERQAREAYQKAREQAEPETVEEDTEEDENNPSES